MGMMPHPERAADALMGSTDGRVILESMVHSLVGHARRMSDLTPFELDKVRSILRREPNETETRHLHGDVERALLLQKLAPASEEAADARRARAARARAKTPASSISADG